MKGLKKIPNQKSLLKAYKVLQFTSHCVGIKQLVLWSQWVRLDPRLGEIIVRYLALFWRTLNPVEINQELKKYEWPAVFGVLVEQISFYHNQYLNKKKWDKQLFFNWSKCVMTNISPAPDEQFFIGLYKAGGKKVKEECLYSIKPYRKWGYFAQDLLINKANLPGKTLMTIPQRKALINELLKNRKKITVQDYLEKINFQIHRRQAQRDLQNHKKIQTIGRTKNKYYFLKK